MNKINQRIFISESYSLDKEQKVDDFFKLLIPNLVTEEEVDKFFKGENSYGLEKYHLFCPRFFEEMNQIDFKQYLVEVIDNNKELIIQSFKIRDKNNQLIFLTFAELFCFLSYPLNQWPQTCKLGESVKRAINITKIQEQCLKELNHLQYLCVNEDRSKLAYYLAALKEAKVDITQLKEIPSNYPSEVYFTTHVKPKSNPQLPKALILFAHPKSDWNGVFLFKESRVLWNSLLSSFDVSLKVIKKIDQINEEILKIENLQLLVLQGHGNTNIIGFSHKKTGSLQTKTLSPKLFEGLGLDALIFCAACLTGKLKNGIAQKIADVSQKTVFAPNADLSCSVTFKDGQFITIDDFCEIRKLEPRPSSV